MKTRLLSSLLLLMCSLNLVIQVTAINYGGLTVSSTITVCSDASTNFCTYWTMPVGDVNKDTYPDIIVGAGKEGVAYLILGRSTNLPSTVDLPTSTPSDKIIKFTGTGDTFMGLGFGYCASTVGDINADGIDDFLIQSPYPFPGASYIFFGKTTWTDNVEVSSFVSGTTGYKITNGPDDGYDSPGYQVRQIGDFNKDGKTDFAMLNTYTIFVFWGGRTWTDDVDVSTMAATVGIKIDLTSLNCGSVDMDGIGDVNADGVDDLGITCAEGASYIVFGKSGLNSDIDLTTLTTSQGAKITGKKLDTVAGVKDVNGDGVADVAFAVSADSPANIYVIFGKSGLADIDVTTLTSSKGVIFKSSSLALVGIGPAGDVNGDTYNDIMVTSDTAPQLIILFGGNQLKTAGTITIDPTDNTIAMSGPADTVYGATFSRGMTADINSDGVRETYLTATKNGELIQFKPGYYTDSSTNTACTSAYCQFCAQSASCTACATGRTVDSKGYCCPSGQYGTSSTACSPCSALNSACTACSDANTCTACSAGVPSGKNCVCPTGQFANSDACTSCSTLNSACTACSDANTCTTCASPKTPSGKNCACPATYYASASSCTACSSLNAFCTACSDANTCTTCSAGTPSGKNCVCPAGKYMGASGCIACSTLHSACTACSDANTCTACSSGNPSGSKCVCPAGQYAGASSCLACSTLDPACTACSDANTCTTCSFGSPSGKTCVCASGQFRDTSACTACSTLNSQCTACSNANTCTTCVSPKTPNGKNCVCPSTYYASGTSCTACSTLHAACTACSDANTCTACSSGSPSGKNCVCLAGQYMSGSTCVACSTLHSACTACSDANTCTACSAGNPSGSKCVCPAGQYAGPSSCLACSTLDPACTACSDANTCTTCSFGSPSGKACVCPSGQFRDTSACTACSTLNSQCTACSDANTCTTCVSPKTPNGKNCVCPSTYYISGTSCTACTTLNSACTACSDANTCTTCVAGTPTGKNCVCPTGKFLSGTSCLACTTLNSACTTCSDANTCATCAAGTPTGKDCVCPAGKYLNGLTCDACSGAITHCTECSSGTMCTKCDSSFYRYEGKCVDSCPAGTVLSGDACVSPPKQSKKYSSGVIAGIVIGGVVGSIGIGALIFFVVKKVMIKKAAAQALTVKVTPNQGPHQSARVENIDIVSSK